jgi:hypothetical protein
MATSPGQAADVTVDGLRSARQAWAHAHVELDTCLTEFIPVALAADRGRELEGLLTPERSHEIAGLYGAAIGAWAHYRELLHRGEAMSEQVPFPARLPAGGRRALPCGVGTST